MHLENVVVDARDPAALGRFWAGLTGAEVITDEPGGVEARLDLGGGAFLDLCLPRVDALPAGHPRLHLDLAGGPRRQELVATALALGARLLAEGRDAEVGDTEGWDAEVRDGSDAVALTDPEGNPFRVTGSRSYHRGTGPIASLRLDSADPARDRRFWAWLTGWVDDDTGTVPALRHPGGRGPLLELCPQRGPKPAGSKNRAHVDVRLAPGEDAGAVVARVHELGGRESDPGWGELPWRVLLDPSGNEWCLLPAAGSARG